MTPADILVKSPCGAADLLAAIFARNRETVREHLGLPPPYRWACRQCGKKLRTPPHGSPTNPVHGLCGECIKVNSLTQVVCPGCGQLSSKRTAELISPARSTQHYFCSRECRDTWYRGRKKGLRNLGIRDAIRGVLVNNPSTARGVARQLPQYPCANIKSTLATLVHKGEIEHGKRDEPYILRGPR